MTESKPAGWGLDDREAGKNAMGRLADFVPSTRASSLMATRQVRDLSEEIGRAAHIYDRLDSEMLDNPLNTEIGI
jgi:hypothetical protein